MSLKAPEIWNKIKRKLGQPSKGNQGPREISIKANTIHRHDGESYVHSLGPLNQLCTLVLGVLANTDLLGEKE